MQVLDLVLICAVILAFVWNQFLQGRLDYHTKVLAKVIERQDKHDAAIASCAENITDLAKAMEHLTRSGIGTGE